MVSEFDTNYFDHITVFVKKIDLFFNYQAKPVIQDISRAAGPLVLHAQGSMASRFDSQGRMPWS